MNSGEANNLNNSNNTQPLQVEHGRTLANLSAVLFSIKKQDKSLKKSKSAMNSFVKTKLFIKYCPANLVQTFGGSGKQNLKTRQLKLFKSTALLIMD